MTRPRLKFFFPDALDVVDPSFDFEKETRSKTRIRQRDDMYAHEVFSGRAYDGLLISKGIVDRVEGATVRYSLAQRQQLRRLGGREFMRLTDKPFPIMGDCGAFTYVKEPKPPFTVDEVMRFYEECDVDFGLSVDHVILTFNASLDQVGANQIPEPLRVRQELTLQLATEFIRGRRSQGVRFMPIGVAQGWSPRSYAAAVTALQKMGYDYIALGGLVPLKTKDIMATLVAVAEVRAATTRLHLLGVTRLEVMPDYPEFGIVSFDSTSPLRQAFKDDRNNYYTPTRNYTAIRVPQVGENASLKRRITAGEVSQDIARRLERDCLESLKAYDADSGSLDAALAALRAYEQVHHPNVNFSDSYAEVLRDRPWRNCPCEICRRLGYHVLLFRGAERNRRRGFHNLWTFYNCLLDCTRQDVVPAFQASDKAPGVSLSDPPVGETLQASVVQREVL